jgi:hypothetical protein
MMVRSFLLFQNINCMRKQVGLGLGVCFLVKIRVRSLQRTDRSMGYSRSRICKGGLELPLKEASHPLKLHVLSFNSLK